MHPDANKPRYTQHAVHGDREFKIRTCQPQLLVATTAAACHGCREARDREFVLAAISMFMIGASAQPSIVLPVLVAVAGASSSFGNSMTSSQQLPCPDTERSCPARGRASNMSSSPSISAPSSSILTGTASSSLYSTPSPSDGERRRSGVLVDSPVDAHGEPCDFVVSVAADAVDSAASGFVASSALDGDGGGGCTLLRVVPARELRWSGTGWLWSPV